MTKATTQSGGEHTFEMLGFSKEEALKMEVRFCLAESIRKFIEREGLTQTEAAEYFGTTQPNISKLINGDTGVFTIDRMIGMIPLTEGKFLYSFKPARKGVIKRQVSAGSFKLSKGRRPRTAKKQVA